MYIPSSNTQGCIYNYFTVNNEGCSTLYHQLCKLFAEHHFHGLSHHRSLGQCQVTLCYLKGLALRNTHAKYDTYSYTWYIKNIDINRGKNRQKKEKGTRCHRM